MLAYICLSGSCQVLLFTHRQVQASPPKSRMQCLISLKQGSEPLPMVEMQIRRSWAPTLLRCTTEARKMNGFDRCLAVTAQTEAMLVAWNNPRQNAQKGVASHRL